jgi:hypothetical protein
VTAPSAAPFVWWNLALRIGWDVAPRTFSSSVCWLRHFTSDWREPRPQNRHIEGCLNFM